MTVPGAVWGDLEARKAIGEILKRWTPVIKVERSQDAMDLMG